MKYILLLACLFLSLSTFSQKKKKEVKYISDENFKFDSLPKILLKELNRFRLSKGLDTLQMSEMLQEAGSYSSEQMAYLDNDKVGKKTTLKNLKKSGATRRGEEVTMKASIGKGKEYYKTEDVAKIIYNRWENNPKNLPVITNPKFTLVGIYCTLDEDGKKVFVSAMFGGYDINNGGVMYKKSLPVPFNSASKKLKNPDLRVCKTCERWRNYDQLQKGIYVHENKIYLKYQNARDLRRILKKSKDGLAVDVVQRNQYINADYNIVDNNLLSKGIMSKVVYRDKFFKKKPIAYEGQKSKQKSKSD